MFLAKTMAEAQRSDERVTHTLFEMGKHGTVDGKVALLYSDFSNWGLRVEKLLESIRTIATWVAVLLIPISLRACGQLF